MEKKGNMLGESCGFRSVRLQGGAWVRLFVWKQEAVIKKKDGKPQKNNADTEVNHHDPQAYKAKISRGARMATSEGGTAIRLVTGRRDSHVRVTGIEVASGMTMWGNTRVCHRSIS